MKARGHAGKRHALLGEDIIDVLQQLLKSETLSSVRQRLESACRQTRVTKPLVIYIHTHTTLSWHVFGTCSLLIKLMHRQGFASAVVAKGKAGTR